MAITQLKPINLKKRNTFVAETSDTDFVAIDATYGAYFDAIEKDGKYALAIKNTVAVAEYYKEVAETVTGALEVKSTGATTGEINYNAETLVGPDGAALYSSAPSNKHVLKVSGTRNVTILKGNGDVWGNLTDLTYTLAHNEIAWVNLDGARFKQMTGANKGKVLLTATDALVFAKVVRLP